MIKRFLLVLSLGLSIFLWAPSVSAQSCTGSVRCLKYWCVPTNPTECYCGPSEVQENCSGNTETACTGSWPADCGSCAATGNPNGCTYTAIGIGDPTPTPGGGGGGGDPNSYDRLFPTFRVLVDVDKNGSGDKVMYTSNTPACSISDEIGPVFGFNFQIPPSSCNPNYVTLYNVKYHSGCPGGKPGNYIDQPSLVCKGETPTRDYYIDVMPDYKVISYGGSGNCVKAWWNPDPGPWFMRCEGTGEWCHGGVDKCPEDIIVVQKITPDNPACTVSGPTAIMNGASASYSISPSNAVTWDIYRKEIHPQPEFGS